MAGPRTLYMTEEMERDLEALQSRWSLKRSPTIALALAALALVVRKERDDA